jgi:hypothetical protein
MPLARCIRALRALPMPEIIALPPGQQPARAAARALSRLAPAALAWPSPPPSTGARRILLVPGLAKAGTTFLFDQLAGQAPTFVTSRTKEANVFSREAAPRRSAYLARFPTLDPAAVLVDASPTYLETADVTVATRIGAVLGGDEVQALVLLRDPVDAVFSHYLHAMKSWMGRPGRAVVCNSGDGVGRHGACPLRHRRHGCHPGLVCPRTRPLLPRLRRRRAHLLPRRCDGEHHPHHERDWRGSQSIRLHPLRTQNRPDAQRHHRPD